MTKEYFEKLSVLFEEINQENQIPAPTEIKHFFSGAALYVNKKISVTWTPVGLAFKLPEQEVRKLISSGNAKALKYFPNGHIKKDYALFESPTMKVPALWKRYFIRSSMLALKKK